MIRLTCIGHLGKDATVNNVNGKSVINFSVAHSEKFKDAQGNQKDKTTWVDCSYWTDKTAISPYLLKGTQVFVEGQPEVRVFDKADGTQGSSLSVRVASIQLLSKTETSAGIGRDKPGMNENNTLGPSDDLPF